MAEFRARWIPLLRSAASSIADVVADWFYYASIVTLAETEPNLEKYILYLWIFFIVSASISGLTLISLMMKGCCPGSKEKPSLFFRVVDKFLALEIVLEDVPELVLSTLISIELDELTPAAVFNITTSAYNLLFNMFDIFQPIEEAKPIPAAEPEPEPEPEEGLTPVVAL